MYNINIPGYTGDATDSTRSTRRLNPNDLMLENLPNGVILSAVPATKVQPL
jgi:hypothetical protein